jgi:hypothetical protein
MSEELIKVTVEGDDEPQVRHDRGNDDDSAAQLAAARADRDAMVQRAHQAEIENFEIKHETALTQAEAAEAQYARAFEEGNVKEMASAQRAIARAEQDITRFGERAQYLKARPAPPSDPIEAFISSKSGPSQKWLRERRHLVEDPRAFAKVNAAHFSAVSEGLQPDSTEYFDHLNRHIGQNGNKNARNGGGVRHATSVEKSRIIESDPNTHDLGNGTVFLTKGERESATDGTIVHTFGPKKGQPVGLAEMARRKAALIKQGAYRRLDQ